MSMAPRRLHPLLLVSWLALLLLLLLRRCGSVSSVSSHADDHDDELNRTPNGVVPRRYLVSRKSSHRSATVPVTPSSGLSSSSLIALAPPRPRPTSTSARQRLLWFVELLAGAVTGVALGVVVTVRFALGALKSEEETNSHLVFGYTVLDPDLMWAQELSSLFREERELPSMEPIGRGACGVVYKAEMPNSDGAVVAIKRIDHQPSIGTAQLCRRDKQLLDKATRQIRSEIMTAGFLRHPNILPVLAHVYRNDRHYLVYEYMRNGSLQDALKGAAGGSRELDWPARFKIARGVAAGLEYLHFVHRPAVIHRDLKPANVLLDEAMEARISDFGLAKEAAHLDDGLTTSNVAGTVGYIAPEYYQVMRFTDKCDVYSFGMILAVLVTGRFPTDLFFHTTDEMCLVGWVRSGMRSEDPAAAVADAKLLGNGFEAQMMLTLKIACFCTYDSPHHRPTMRDVRCMLSQIKH